MSLIGKMPRNHPQQVAVLGVDDTVDDRRTPDGLFRELHHMHRFTVDVAASAENAQLSRFYTRADDGMAQSWAGERVWCNPPYSDIGPWVEKAWGAMRAGCELVVMLLPSNRTEQEWWQRYVEPRRDRAPDDGIRLTTRFLKGRRNFGYPPGMAKPKSSPPFGLVLLIWEAAA